jgi:hypothetical protein
LYCLTVWILAVVLAYVVVPKHGRTNPVVYISITFIVGPVSVMFVKGFSVAANPTFAGKNQFIYPRTYIFDLISVGCILIQLNCYNKALNDGRRHAGTVAAIHSTARQPLRRR